MGCRDVLGALQSSLHFLFSPKQNNTHYLVQKCVRIHQASRNRLLCNPPVPADRGVFYVCVAGVQPCHRDRGGHEAG